ncbi:MAG: hypothetical protein C4293_09680 [Nitrospiraceae bacterium]
MRDHTTRILTRIKRAVVCTLAWRFPTCGLQLKTDIPLVRRWHRSPHPSPPRQLFVFLPGIADTMEDYRERCGSGSSNMKRLRPALFLGYGERDKFASAHSLLQQILPRRHVFTTKGGHNWPT